MAATLAEIWAPPGPPKGVEAKRREGACLCRTGGRAGGVAHWDLANWGPATVTTSERRLRLLGQGRAGLVPSQGATWPALGDPPPAQSRGSFPPVPAESLGAWESVGAESRMPPPRRAAPPPRRPFLFLFVLPPATGSAFPVSPSQN